MDIAFVLDGSVSSREWDQNKDIALSLIESLEDDIDEGRVQIGVVTSGDDVDINFMIGDHDSYSDVERAISRLRRPSARNNALLESLNTLRTGVFRNSGRRDSSKDMIIVLSNGEDLSDTDEIIDLKQTMEGDGFTFFTSYINQDEDYQFIRQLATANYYSTYDNILVRKDLSQFEGALIYANKNMPRGKFITKSPYHHYHHHLAFIT